jgi:hypothetical protein
MFNSFFLVDVSYKSYRVKKPLMGTNDPYDNVYHNLPNKHFVLRKVRPCGYCGAKRYPAEGPTFCCRKGKVKLHIPDVLDELRRLFTSQTDQDAQYFRKHIRYFNSHFSFTSLGVNLDERYNTPKGSGVSWLGLPSHRSVGTWGKWTEAHATLLL